MRRDTCTTCGGAFKTDRDGLWSGDKREHRCESTCVKHLKERLAAAEAHEQQTHERLGAILGTDTSLEDAAKRMAERLAAAERVLECGHTARFTTSHFGGEKHGESYCTLCELDTLTARLAAAEAAARFYAKWYDGPAEALLGEEDRRAFMWIEENGGEP